MGQLAQAEVVQGEAAAAAGAKLEALLDQARVSPPPKPFILTAVNCYMVP